MTPGGLWDSNKIEIKAIVKLKGEVIDTVPLEFSGTPSVFNGRAHVKKMGNYDVFIYAYDKQTGNTGVSKAVVSVR
ncbi:MAG: hypothetical protein ISR96_09870 [Nitrospira sp.]|nr:hypothetical protein [Nitrospira sp.]